MSKEHIMSRHQKLAEILVNYSTTVKKGETVRINGTPASLPLMKEVAKLCYQKGAYVLTEIYHEELQFIKYKYAAAEVLKKPNPFLMHEVKNCDIFIRLGGEENTNVFSQIDPKRIQEEAKANQKAKQILIGKRWVLCDYPTSGLAQDAGMSLTEYEDFMFSACLQDWKKISHECKRVGEYMHKARKIRIIGQRTDLTVDIKGCPASSHVKEKQGEHNMPDGEVFTSPNRWKTEGHVYFPWPSKRDKEVRDIYFEFRKGQIVRFECSQNRDYLDQVLKTDKLSSSLGEIAIGLNYGVKKYTNNILYDEKMGGTIHMAIGAGYAEVKGDPRSAVHWDFVKDMTKGEVWFDNTLILKDGKILIK